MLLTGRRDSRPQALSVNPIIGERVAIDILAIDPCLAAENLCEIPNEHSFQGDSVRIESDWKHGRTGARTAGA